MTSLPRPLRAPAFWIAVLVFAIYAYGACRTIFVGDSGELTAAAATLGIPHPTGYPLYPILGKIFITLVPIGSIAFRMSLFSAFFGALSCALLYRLARDLKVEPPGAAFAAFALAFAPSMWSQANIQRVYTLNVFFVIALVWAAMRWWRDRDVKMLTLAFFFGGLGATNHTILGIITIVMSGWVVLTEPSILKRPKQIAGFGLATLVGLLPYAYLPIRSRANPRLDWENPETLEGFLDVVLRRNFWQRAWMEQPSDWWIVLGDFTSSLGEEMLWPGVALLLFGLFLVVRDRQKRFPLFLPPIILVSNVVIMGLHGSRSDLFIWHRYYLAAYAMAILLAALAWQVFTEKLPDRPWRRIVVWLVLLLPAAQLALGWQKHDRSRFRIADDFSRTLLETIPPGAHLAASDDNILFVLIYLHLAEGVRPDINLVMQGIGGIDLPALRFDPESDPLYFTHHPNWNMQGIDLAPVGLAFQVVRSDMPPPEPVIPKWELEGENDPRVPKDYLTQNLIGHFHYMLGITHEQRDWPIAHREFTKATDVATTNDVLFYNLGLIYRRNGLLRRSLASFERSAEINPRHIASSNPVRAVDKVAEMRPEIERLDAMEQEIAASPALQGLEHKTAAWHRAMADGFVARGEALIASGHARLALEAEADL